ncbi:MAG: hydroxylamine reductase [Lachnospiraceae bacterium]|nr:hydroxylamine reductase [Lachnospiraceae bacterium]
MFCFQCEQTAGCSACTKAAGVCGKTADVAFLQDKLTGALIGLARCTDGDKSDKMPAPDAKTARLMMEGLFATLTNVNFDADALNRLYDEVQAEKNRLMEACKDCADPCGRRDDYNMDELWNAQEDIRSLKSLILFGLRGVAAYAYHAMILGYTSDDVINGICRGMFLIGEDLTMEQLLPEVLEVGRINLVCMELLDRANTAVYGTPAPASVGMKVEKGPFIVITGHDLHDLQMLLEQTEGKGINVYTHGEMLPAHAYPRLNQYAHLKGNYGSAWQNQRSEFDHLPAPILYTTNCLMPPKESYADRLFTTGAVAYPEMVFIGEDAQGNKDFTPVIEKALALGGFSEDKQFTGMNGGTQMTTGFGHQTVLSVADKVIDAVKAGALKHIFLVGGCDGIRNSRSYYTDFVKQTPDNTAVLTLACGKYRFNDLDLGTIGGLPRLMDMGQCNDAYSAIRVAVALAEAFGCGVNDLPLTLVLSWYEQKAVSILLTLLHLGIKNIYLGPTLPAFVSPAVLNFLVENYAVTPVSTPEEDLKKILG